ncbi:MAG: hypothetical protein ACK5MH_10170 [Bacteroidales bacterium]
MEFSLSDIPIIEYRYINPIIRVKRIGVLKKKFQREILIFWLKIRKIMVVSQKVCKDRVI